MNSLFLGAGPEIAWVDEEVMRSAVYSVEPSFGRSGKQAVW
ncbi:hypothetical protein HRbin33_01618 [bacterium HR33]|nr:hypothetical protein HRbin33_01618 [bacterium HR33]